MKKILFTLLTVLVAGSSMHAVRYLDKYVKIDGRWWIAEREQYFEWSAFPPLA